jgi:hypothetical protein
MDELLITASVSRCSRPIEVVRFSKAGTAMTLRFCGRLLPCPATR